jgi:hypothetical protein
MRYLTSSELHSFHDSFLQTLRKHSLSQSDEDWGYPGGFHICETHLFETKHGNMYIGHLDSVEDAGRWWIPVTLEDNIRSLSATQLSIDFEMSIPVRPNFHLSTHYIKDEGNLYIVQKGNFTVGHSGIKMSDFFQYYLANPGRWQVIQFNGYDYLILVKLALKSIDAEFPYLIDSLADFANYIPGFKNRYRS